MSIEQFAKFITEQRKERGLTQNDLAKKLSVTDKAVSKWERGLNYPDISTIEALAKVFDVTVLELLNGEKKMGQDLKEKESIDKAVAEALDFSKQLIRNQKKNYLNQGLILIIVFLLVLVGYQGYNQMFGSFGTSVHDLNIKIFNLQDKLDQLQIEADQINLYGNGIYYCKSPDSTFESIEFVTYNIIRVYSHAVPTVGKEELNIYFRLAKTDTHLYKTVADVTMDDTKGLINLNHVKHSWYVNGLNLFRVVEISEDHKTLYYGSDHSYTFCTLNSVPKN